MMEANSQHEFHPDAESLNAFAEHVLGERERGEVLKHLAVCGRCRHVVALAWDAAGAEVAAEVAEPAGRAAIPEPSAWWKRWRLVWVPTAVVAAFAAASISVYIHQTGQHETSIKIAEQPPMQGKEPASVPSQRMEAEAAPPAASAPSVPAPKVANALKAKRSGVEARQQAPEPAAPSAMPREPEAMDRAELGPVQPAPASGAETSGLAGDGFLVGGRPAVYKAQATGASQDAQRQQEEKKLQAENAKLHGGLFAAKAAPPAAEYSAESGKPESSVPVVISGDMAEMRPAPMASFGELERSRSSAIAARAAKAIHLPSNLRPVSIAVADHRMLAIDEAGALFLSEDSGSTWKSVAQEWTGRAEVVRRQTAGQGSAAQATGAETVEKARAEAGEVPAIVFELLNDKGQVWLSSDGKTWVAK